VSLATREARERGKIMKRKNLLLWSLLFILCWVVPTAVQAASAPIKLVVNGSYVTPDVPPQVVKERTMVPVSFLGKAYGVDVQWDQTEKTVTIDNGNGKKIVMKPGQTSAYVNGSPVTLAQAPLIIEQRTFLPLRIVGELLDATIGWENTTKTVVVNQPQSMSINGSTLPSTPIFQLSAGYYVNINNVAKPLGYEVKQSAGKLVLEQGTEKYTISQATGNQSDGYRMIETQYAISPEYLSRMINATSGWNQNHTAFALDKLQKITGYTQTDDEITIRSEGKMSYSHFYLDDGNHVVIDFNHAVKDSSVQNQEFTSPLVKGIRFGQQESPDRVRVVLDLTKKAGYTISAVDGETKITVKEEISTPVPAPVPAPAPVPQPANSGKFVIVLDPGHGGKDPGASGTIGNHEKDLVLAIAKKTEAILSQNPNFKVIMTRTGDTYPTLQERAALANNLKANVFMSFHANAGPSTAHGTETYYTTPQSKEFASILHKHLLKATGFTDRHLRTANYYVIKNTKMPSTLIEIGFLTNSADNAAMLTPALQQRVAEEMAAGITEYYNKHH
jgi:N-acetylmuramoyl-L-alanine amidase